MGSTEDRKKSAYALLQNLRRIGREIDALNASCANMPGSAVIDSLVSAVDAADRYLVREVQKRRRLRAEAARLLKS